MTTIFNWVSKEEPEQGVYYAWFSEKQFNHVESTHGLDRPYIYYRLQDGSIVQISEVTSSSTYNSNFDDVKYLGLVKKFHCASRNQIIDKL